LQTENRRSKRAISRSKAGARFPHRQIGVGELGDAFITHALCKRQKPVFRVAGVHGLESLLEIVTEHIAGVEGCLDLARQRFTGVIDELATQSEATFAVQFRVLDIESFFPQALDVVEDRLIGCHYSLQGCCDAGGGCRLFEAGDSL
jgi:hypothetical protein